MLVLFDGDHGLRDTVHFIEEQGGAGLWRWDLTDEEMQWSTGFFRLLGVERDSVSPSFEYLQAVTHPEDVRPPGELEAIVTNGGALRREFRIIQPSGRVRWLSSCGEVLLDKTGAAIRVVGVVFDVTLQHEMRARAETLQARLTSIVESLGASAWCTGPDGRGIDVLGWCKFTGQSPREAIGYGWLDAVHPDDRADVLAAWKDAVGRGERYDKEYRLRGTDGQYRAVRAFAAPVRGKDGKIFEWAGMTVELHSRRDPTGKSSSELKLTGAQLRAGRALLNWSVKDLADHAGVSPSTIRRLEESDAAPKGEEPALPLLQAALEQRGVAFLFPTSGPPSVGLSRGRTH